MDPNKIYSVLSFLAVFVYVHVGVYTYRKHKKSNINRTFLAICAVLAVWSFAYGFAYVAPNQQVFYFWNKLSAIGWCSVSGLSLYFVMMITESKLLRSRVTVYLVFVPSVLLFFMAVTLFGPGMSPGKNMESVFYLMDLSNNLICFLLSTALLWDYRNKTKNARIRKQANIILVSSVVPYLFIFATQNVILDRFGLKFPNISQIILQLTMVGIFYAINKYKFMHIPEEAILEQVEDEMQDMIIILDAEGKMIRLSRHTLERLEYRDNELIGNRLDCIMPARNGFVPEYEKLKMADRKYRDLELRGKNGLVIPVSATIRRVIDSKLHDLIGIVVILQDISVLHELGRKNDELEAYIDELKAAEDEIRFQYSQNLVNERRVQESEERFRTVFEKAPMGINLCDTTTGKFLTANRKYEEITGRSAEELLNCTWMDITHPDDLELNNQNTDRLINNEVENFRMNKRYVRPDGTVVWVNMIVSAMDIEGNENPCELCLVEDITERRKYEDELKDSEYTFRKLFNASADSILLLEGSRIVDCNPATINLLGLRDKREVVGRSNTDISPECQPDGAKSSEKYDALIADMDTKSKVRFEWWYQKEDGETFPVEIMMTSIMLKGKMVLHAIWRDIGERKQMEKRLEYLNYHDQLTGLYNRRFFEEELYRMDVPRNYPIALVMADVNGLKLMNDSFGHSVGDQLLKKVGAAIERGCRGDDVVARLGGDEFVILLPRTDRKDTEMIIKRIKEITSKEKVGSLDISISFGYDIKREFDTANEEVLKRAEDMMYKNKLFESRDVKSSTINSMLQTLHEKDKRELIHTQRVTKLCRKLGLAMGLSKEQIDEIITVAQLHDIGKITLDEHILNNPGRLNQQEWEEVKRHPEIGYRILNTVTEMSEIAKYVLSHHERWDGAGYPKQLVGEEIPLQSRIIAIIDAYAAMTSERSYREPIPEETAIVELRKNAGLQFDPELIDMFVNNVLPTGWPRVEVGGSTDSNEVDEHQIRFDVFEESAAAKVSLTSGVRKKKENEFKKNQKEGTN